MIEREPGGQTDSQTKCIHLTLSNHAKRVLKSWSLSAYNAKWICHLITPNVLYTAVESHVHLEKSITFRLVTLRVNGPLSIIYFWAGAFKNSSTGSTFLSTNVSAEKNVNIYRQVQKPLVIPRCNRDPIWTFRAWMRTFAFWTDAAKLCWLRCSLNLVFM